MTGANPDREAERGALAAAAPARPPAGGSDRSLWLLGGLCAASGAAVAIREGGAAVGQVIAAQSALALAVAPKLLGAVLLVAWLRRLIPRDRIARAFGRASGALGLARSAVGGALVPGGPAAAYPVLATLSRLGADMGASVAFASGWLLLGLSRVLIWELAFLPVDLVLARMALCLPFAVLLGLAARRTARSEPGA